MSNADQLFNQTYLGENKVIQKSLINFFNNDVRMRLLNKSDLRILEIGAGNYSVFESLENESYSVLAIDKLDSAIMNSPVSKIKYLKHDYVKDHIDEEFDLIVDAHFFHCLTEDSERKTALSKILDNLNEDGIFISEMMVLKSHQKFLAIPFKRIDSAFEIEKLLLENGFKIMMFRILSGSQFYSTVNNEEVTTDILQIIAMKK